MRLALAVLASLLLTVAAALLMGLLADRVSERAFALLGGGDAPTEPSSECGETLRSVGEETRDVNVLIQYRDSAGATAAVRDARLYADSPAASGVPAVEITRSSPGGVLQFKAVFPRETMSRCGHVIRTRIANAVSYRVRAKGCQERVLTVLKDHDYPSPLMLSCSAPAGSGGGRP